MTVRIAITGGIGAGKSLLAGWLRAAGHPVLDADGIGRRVVEENPALRQELAAAFGGDLLTPTGLQRAELGRRAFASAEGTARLNALVFPYLWSALLEELEACRAPACFVDAALIVDWGVADHFQELWLVRAPAELRLDRAAGRLGLPQHELRSRLERQADPQRLLKRATCVLDNDGPPDRFWDQAERQLRRLGLDGLPSHTRPA